MESIVAREDGVVVETSASSYTPKVVVGADGVGSVVRRSMGLSPGQLRAQVLELDTEAVAGDPDRRTLHFDAADLRFSGYYWDFPTVVDGRPLVCRGIYHLRVDDRPVDIDALLTERLAKAGLAVGEYKKKRYAERGWVRPARLADRRRILIGEAAGIDPVTGEGIAQAIEYGWLAGRFLARVLRAEQSVEEWTDVLYGSRLARDLAIRSWGAHAFYGAHRRRIERFLLRHPSMMHVGCQHFAHQPYHPGKLADMLVGAGALFAGVSFARAAHPA